VTLKQKMRLRRFARLYKACRCWRVDFERVEEERDDLRAKLEASEKLSEQRRLQIGYARRVLGFWNQVKGEPKS